MISKFENGSRKPTKEQVLKLSTILDINYETLMVEWLKQRILYEIGDDREFALKAMMVASGGLSGGISSSIAGGKFMDGFRQGIITAGLNHVAHLTSDSFPKNDSELNDSELLVLLDAQGGSGLGYTGMAGGNDDKGWDYVSNEGAKKWKLYNWRRFKSC